MTTAPRVRRPSPQDADRGSATILVLALAMVLVVAAGGAALVGAAVTIRHTAETAADLAALSAARDVLRGDAAACSTARRVAESNGASLRTCSVSNEGAASLVDVVVSVEAKGPLARLPPASAHARAGPVDPLSSGTP